MATFLQSIIDKLSYDQGDLDTIRDASFVLKPGGIFLTQGDASKYSLYNYLLTESTVTKDKFKKFFEAPTNSSTVDEDFQKFLGNVNSFLNDIVGETEHLLTSGDKEELEAVGSIAAGVNTTGMVYSFKKEQIIKIIDNGIGKDFAWCRIILYTNNVIVPGFCLRSDVLGPKTNKKLISDFNDYEWNNTRITKDKQIPLSLDFEIDMLTHQPDQVSFDETTAAYYVIKETGYSSIPSSPSDLEEDFIGTYKSGIVQILASLERKFDIDTVNKLLNENYLFARVDRYFINPRNGPFSLLVVIPFRNILAVAERTIWKDAKDTLALLSDVQSTVDSAGNYINNLANETGFFNIDQRYPNIASFLGQYGASGSPSINYLSELGDAVSRPSAGKYLNGIYEKSSDMFKNGTYRSVNFIHGTRSNALEKTLLVLESINKKINEKIEKKEIKIAIDIEMYIDIFKGFIKELYALLDLPQNKLFEIKSIVFEFKDGTFNDIYGLYGSTSSRTQLVNVSSIIESSTYNEPTFLYLLSNINEISQGKEKENITGFLDKYIYPEELAAVEILTFIGSNAQKEGACLKSYAEALADQVPARINNFISDTGVLSADSIANLQKTFSSDGWSGSAISDIFDGITDWNTPGSFKSRFKDPKTINWDYIIEETLRCVKDENLKSTLRWLLLAIKDRLANGTPIACSIPPLTIPRFPRIGLPPFPDVPGSIDAYYFAVGDALVKARTKAIQAIIDVILDLRDTCDNDQPPDTVGKASQAEVFNPNNDTGSIADALTAEDGELDSNDIKITLEKTFEVLTQPEIRTLFFGDPTPVALSCVKREIEKFSKANQYVWLDKKLKNSISNGENITYTTLNDQKVKTFYKRMSRYVKPESATEKFPSSTDPLCLNTPMEQDPFYKLYLEKGITAEQAEREVINRRLKINEKIEAVATIASRLSADVLLLQPINCTINPDGTVTPGIADSVPLPPVFMAAQEKTVKNLYQPFEKEYDIDYKNFFTNSCEDEFTYDPEKLQTDPVKLSSSLFLKTPYDSFKKLTISNTSSNCEDYDVVFGFRKILAASGLTSISSVFEAYSVANKFLSDIKVDTKQGGIDPNIIQKLISSQERSNKITGFYDAKYTSDGDNKISTDTCIDISFKSPGILRRPELIPIIGEGSLDIPGKFDRNSDTIQLTGIELDSSLPVDTIDTISQYYDANSIDIGNINRKKSRNGTDFTVLAKQKDYVDNYIGLVMTRLSNSPLMSVTKFKFGDSEISKNDILDYLKNEIPSEDDKLCAQDSSDASLFDKRLINTIYKLKEEIISTVKKSSCIYPVIDTDGNIKDSSADFANKFAACKMLLKIVSIETCLKLGPYVNLLGCIDTDIISEVCYYIFDKSLRNIFTEDDYQMIFATLIQKYFVDTQQTAGGDYTAYANSPIDQNKYRRLAFIKYFDPIFKETISDINKKLPNNIRADSGCNLADYEYSKKINFVDFFNAIEYLNTEFTEEEISFLDQRYRDSHNYRSGAVGTFLFDPKNIDILQEIFCAPTGELDLLLDNMNSRLFIGPDGSVIPLEVDVYTQRKIGEEYVDTQSFIEETKKYPNFDPQNGEMFFCPAGKELISSNVVEETYFLFEEFVVSYKTEYICGRKVDKYELVASKVRNQEWNSAKNLIERIVEFCKRPLPPRYEEFVTYFEKITSVLNEFELQNTCFILTADLDSITISSFGSQFLQSLVKDDSILKKFKKKLDKVERINGKDVNIYRDPIALEMLRELKEIKLSISTELHPIYKKSISPGYDLTKVDEDVELKQAFSFYISNILCANEINQYFLAIFLLSITSIRKIENSFIPTKFAITQILDIITTANTPNRASKKKSRTGFERFINYVKAGLQVPDFLIKGVAKVIDPNIMIANYYSMIYEMAIAAAAMSGADITKLPKTLPLFVTSPLAPPFFPPTPPGVYAVISSFKDLDINFNLPNKKGNGC